MSGTTPGNSSGDERRDDPFSQPSQEPGRSPSWEGGELPRWEQDNAPSSPYAQPTPEPPKPIVTAVRLMYVGAALTALSFILVLFNRDSIRDSIAETNDNLSADEIDTMANVSFGFLAVLMFVSIALWLWMAYANRKGRGWARVVATILGGLNILFALLNITAGGMSASTIINLISPVLAAVILYLLYRPESGEYYRTMSAPRSV